MLHQRALWQGACARGEVVHYREPPLRRDAEENARPAYRVVAASPLVRAVHVAVGGLYEIPSTVAAFAGSIEIVEHADRVVRSHLLVSKLVRCAAEDRGVEDRVRRGAAAQQFGILHAEIKKRQSVLSASHSETAEERHAITDATRGLQSLRMDAASS